MSFGENLRSLIEERNMTQKELAMQLNIAPSTMGSYVQNTREPDFATLKLLANYFDVSIDYLLDNFTGKVADRQEAELLRIFRSLPDEQKSICIEQCRVFVRMNYQEKEAKSSSWIFAIVINRKVALLVSLPTGCFSFHLAASI